MRRNLLLLALLLLLTAANLWQGGGPETRSFRFLPEMNVSPAVTSFSETPLLPEGSALQPPPAHTVPRDLLPLPYTASEQDAVRAGTELRNPIEESDAVLARGREIFRNFCTPCHGGDATGSGQVVSRGFPAPPSLLATHARQLPEGRIFHILTFGQGNMPTYRYQLSRAERWTVIRHVRKLQQEAMAP